MKEESTLFKEMAQMSEAIFDMIIKKKWNVGQTLTFLMSCIVSTLVTQNSEKEHFDLVMNSLKETYEKVKEEHENSMRALK